jgi:hypothetical protein
MVDELPVVTVDWAPADGEKAIFGRARDAVARVSSVGAAQLAANVTRLCQQVGEVFAQASTEADNLELTSVEVTVEVAAGGELRLVGAVSSQVTGGLKLVFTKRDTPHA